MQHEEGCGWPQIKHFGAKKAANLILGVGVNHSRYLGDGLEQWLSN